MCLDCKRRKWGFACRCAAAPSGVHSEQEQQDTSSYFSAVCLAYKILNCFPASDCITRSIPPICTKLSKWRGAASTSGLPALSSWGRTESSSLKKGFKAQKQSEETLPRTRGESCALWEMVVHQNIARPKHAASMKVSK